jgi:O-antigen ligase
MHRLGFKLQIKGGKDYNIVVMNTSKVNKNHSKNKHLTDEVIDILLFLVLGVLTAVFTISGLPQITVFPISYPFKHLTYDKLYSLLLLLCTLIYTFLYFIFIERRYKKTGKRISKWLIAFLIAISCSRAISNFSFPYGEINWNILSPFDSINYTLNYSGYSILHRFIAFITEVAFISYFLLPFTFIKSFESKKIYGLIKVGLWFLVILGLVMNICSWFMESKEILFNIKIILGKEHDNFHPIQSFTTHKNYYGFFLWMSALASLILYMEKPSHAFLYLLFILNDLVVLTIVRSRIPFGLVVLVILFMLIHMAFVNRKLYKANHIFALCVLALAAFTFLVFLIFFRDTSLFSKIRALFTSFSDTGTITSRKELHLRAICLLIKPFYWIFGIGKEPYYQLFHLAGETFGMEVVDFSHNAYLDQILCYGIFGLGLLCVLFGVLIYQCFYLIRKKNYKGFGYLFILISYGIYAIGESRLLFGIEGNEYFFILALLYPLIYEYEKTRNIKDYKAYVVREYYVYLLTKGLKVDS